MSLLPQEKQKVTLTAIYATIVLIICLMATLVVSFIIDSGEPTPSTEPAPMTFVTLSVTDKELHSGSLVLVNKANKYVFEDNPAVVPVPSSEFYGIRDGYLKANPQALEALATMMQAFDAATPDANAVIMTAFRSEEDQTKLDNGTPAGHSDFHTGMSFELKDGESYVGINKLEKYKWLYENAHKYGFIVRYPDDTEQKRFSLITGVEDYSWVLRYVGVAHASYIYKNGLCLEEYLELLRNSHSAGNNLTVKAGDSKTYEVYYCPAGAEIQVPEKYSYEISGDNMNGFIVTVSKAKTK